MHMNIWNLHKFSQLKNDSEENKKTIEIPLMNSHSASNLKIIFEMAKNGEPRPSGKTSIGKSLNSYLKYEDFKEMMMNIASHWFR